MPARAIVKVLVSNDANVWAQKEAQARKPRVQIFPQPQAQTWSTHAELDYTDAIDYVSLPIFEIALASSLPARRPLAQ